MPYEVKLEAKGGVTPYLFGKGTYQPDLDPALQVTFDGYIRGTPERAGIYDTVLAVRDISGRIELRTFRLTIAAADPLRLLTPSLPVAALGQAYSAPLSAAGGTPPYRFSLALGPLPEGVSLGEDGVLRGTPSRAGSFRFGYRVRDARDTVLVGNATLIVQGTRLSLMSTALAAAQRGVPYEATLQGNGGRAPYRFRVTGGSLPPGLTLSSTGSVTGTPTTNGEFTFRVEINDSENGYGEVELRLSVAVSLGPLTMRESNLAPARFRERYSGRVEASGGQPPYTFSIREGAVPPGMALGADGTIQGWALGTGQYDFVVEVRDARGEVATRGLRWESQGTTLPAGIALERYQTRFGAAGVRYEVLAEAGNQLPLGLSLNPDGSLEGLLWQQGDHAFRLRKLLANGTVEVEAFLLAATPRGAANRVEDFSIPAGVVGRGYGHRFQTRRGGAARWRLERGALPPGLTLEADGQLRGLPSEAGVWNFSVEAEPGGQAAFSLAVLAAEGPRVTAVTNGASYGRGAAARGELLAIFGEGIGPAALRVAELSGGALPRELGGVRFWVNGAPAPLLFTASGQASIVTPWLGEGERVLRLEVERGGRRSVPWVTPLFPADPGLFTAGGNGQGGAAALNADGSAHGEAKPAAEGGVVVLFGTGLGRLERSGPSGGTASEAVRVAAEVRCLVDGKPAEVLYAGVAPGLLEAVNQVNVRLPSGLGPGPHRLVLVLEEWESNPVTIWVKSE